MLKRACHPEPRLKRDRKVRAWALGASSVVEVALMLVHDNALLLNRGLLLKQ